MRINSLISFNRLLLRTRVTTVLCVAGFSIQCASHKLPAFEESVDATVPDKKSPVDPVPEPKTPVSEFTVTDPLYPLQKWYFDAARIPEAWKLTTGSKDIIVAVIDTGQVDHPDLNEKWVGGYNFIANLPSPVAPISEKQYNHGTHVAGIIAASANTIGSVGVCPNCKVMPILGVYIKGSMDLYPSSGYKQCREVLKLSAAECRIKMTARSIRYAAGLEVDNGYYEKVKASRPADVINISSGNELWDFSEYPKPQKCMSDELQDAINAAVAEGVPVVVASGNWDPPPDREWPPKSENYNAANYLWGYCKNVIRVTAVGEVRRISDRNEQRTGEEALEPYATGSWKRTHDDSVTLGAPGGRAYYFFRDLGGLFDSWGSGFGELINCPTNVDYSSTDHFFDPTKPVSPSNRHRGFGTQGIVSTWFTPEVDQKEKFKDPGTACYRHWSGTSMAAPMVSGVVALMRTKNRALTPDQISYILQATARKVRCSKEAPLNPEHQDQEMENFHCGAGMIDAYAAVAATMPPEASIECKMLKGTNQFSCSPRIHYGAPEFKAQWTTDANTKIEAGTLTNLEGIRGTCSPNGMVNIKLEVTDHFGRKAIAKKDFTCSESLTATRTHSWQVTVGPMVFAPKSSIPLHRADYGSLATRTYEWLESLAMTDSFKFYANSFNPGVSYPEMSSMASLLNARGIRTTIEVGGLRDYPLLPSTPIPRTCSEYTRVLGLNTAKLEFSWLKRWIDVGGKVHVLAMDHPLHSLRRKVADTDTKNPRPKDCVASVPELVEQLGVYMETMTKDLDAAGVHGVEFALIDTALGYDVTGLDGHAYPSTDAALTIGSFRTTLASIINEAKRRGVRFTAYHSAHGLEGAEVDSAIRSGSPLPRTLTECQTKLNSPLDAGRFLGVERDVRELGLKLGVVANASHQCHYAIVDMSHNYPEPDSVSRGTRSAHDRTMLWLEQILQGMKSPPDDMIFQTWFRYPERTLPETSSDTYLSLVRDMFHRAVPERIGSGMFRTFGAIFKVDPAKPDQFCVFRDWASYLAAGGDPTLKGVATYGAMPTAQSFVGNCP